MKEHLCRVSLFVDTSVRVLSDLQKEVIPMQVKRVVGLDVFYRLYVVVFFYDCGCCCCLCYWFE